MQQLVAEIDRISSVTSWAGQKLLDASIGSFSFQIGSQTSSADVLSVNIAATDATTLGVKSAASTTVSAAAIDAATATTGITLGANGGALTVAIASNTISSGSVSSNLTDTNVAASYNNTDKSITFTQAAQGVASVASQIASTGTAEQQKIAVNGANVLSKATYTLKDSTGATIATFASTGSAPNSMAALATGLNTGKTAALSSVVIGDGSNGGTTNDIVINFANNGVQGAVTLDIARVAGSPTGSGGDVVSIDLTDYIKTGANAGANFDLTIGSQTFTVPGSAYAGTTEMLTALAAAEANVALDSNSVMTVYDADPGDAANSNGATVIATMAENSQTDTTLVVTYANSATATAVGVTSTLTGTETVAGVDDQGSVTGRAAITDETLTVNVGGTNFSVDLTGLSSSTTAAQTATAVKAALDADSTFTSQFSAADDGNGKLTFTAIADGNVQANGNVSFTLNGVAITAAVSANDTQAAVTTAIANAINAATIDAHAVTGASRTTATNNGGGSITVATTAYDFDLTTRTNSVSAINAIDAAINTVNTQRGTLGSFSNRLDSTVSNLTNISNNLSAGRGRIEDADFAAETTQLAKTQILQQASTAMLAQANASKQNVLSLLQG
jgi:flagellin